VAGGLSTIVCVIKVQGITTSRVIRVQYGGVTRVHTDPVNVHIPFTFPLPRVASCQNLRLGFALGNDQRLSPSNAARMDAPETPTPIALDNHRRAVTELSAMARVLAESSGHHIESLFLGEPVLPYRPCYPAGE
jgi:hypothetical protein